MVEFVVGATVGKGSGVVYLAMAKDTGGLKHYILKNCISNFHQIYFLFYFPYANNIQ